MYVMINPNEVRSHSIFLENKTEEYEKIRLNILEKINSSNAYWKGKDAEIFREKAEAYFKGLDRITNILKEYSIMFKKTSDAHENLDKRFASEIRSTLE